MTETARAVRYTMGHEQAVLANHATRTAQNSAGYLLEHLRPGMTVLDVGCGPASITLDLAELVAPGVVTGIENAPAPLETARVAAAERGDTTTRFELADVMELPYDDDSFDVVHAHQVLQHLADPVGALREMARVARPGGLLAVRDADYAAMHWYPASAALDLWLGTYRSIARRNGGEPDAGRHLRRWAREAGLSEVTFSMSTWAYTDEATCSWWANSQAARTSGATFQEQARQLGLMKTQLDAIPRGWQLWGQQPDTWFVIPNAELLARV